MNIRKGFTGMLPAAIAQFEQLMEAAADLHPQVIRGYDCQAGRDNFFYWGCAAQITCDDMAHLRIQADALGLAWLNDNGELAYTKGLTISDFQTFRVNGDLELTPEREEQKWETT